jgi:hypothetical protein
MTKVISNSCVLISFGLVIVSFNIISERYSD